MARIARIETPLLKLLRDEGRTQVWLAGRLGVLPQQLTFWVHGIHEPREETKIRIARILKRTGAELGWPEIDPIEEPDDIEMAA